MFQLYNKTFIKTSVNLPQSKETCFASRVKAIVYPQLSPGFKDLREKIR